MTGIKNRGSKIHRVKTDYTRKLKHKDGLAYDRNMCDNLEETNSDDDEPEPDGSHNEKRIT